MTLKLTGTYNEAVRIHTSRIDYVIDMGSYRKVRLIGVENRWLQVKEPIETFDSLRP